MLAELTREHLLDRTPAEPFLLRQDADIFGDGTETVLDRFCGASTVAFAAAQQAAPHAAVRTARAVVLKLKARAVAAAKRHAAIVSHCHQQR